MISSLIISHFLALSVLVLWLMYTLLVDGLARMAQLEKKAH